MQDLGTKENLSNRQREQQAIQKLREMLALNRRERTRVERTKRRNSLSPLAKLELEHAVCTKARESRVELEFQKDPCNILPAVGSCVGHIMAKRSSCSAPIPDASHLIALLVSGALLALGVVIFSGNYPYKLAIGLTALIAGCCVGIAAFRSKRKS